MKVFGFTYIFGNPKTREKIADALNLAKKSVIGAFAFIGLCTVGMIVCQIMAW